MTLIEILIVVGIIMLLAGLLFPVYPKIREKGRQTTCLSNQRQLCMDISFYAQENREVLPQAATVWTDIGAEPKLLLCPSGTDTTNCYGFNAAVAGRTLGSIGSPASTFLTVDGKNPEHIISDPADINKCHDNRVIAGYADGHVKLVDAP